MSLLPYQVPKITQDFTALMLDKAAMCTYIELNSNPLTCKASLLKHLAQSENLNIDEMLVSEARTYIANARKIYSIKGTPKSILNALASIGLHTADEPAEIIEYRDLTEKYLIERKYNGVRFFDGSWKFKGTKHNFNFTLSYWYEFAVIISKSMTRRQEKMARRLINENKPLRCELKALVMTKNRIFDGTWKFGNKYKFDGSYITN